MVTNALTIAGGSTPTGTLDVTNNAVVVDYPAAGPNPEATIRDQIIAGRGGERIGHLGRPGHHQQHGFGRSGELQLGGLRGQRHDAVGRADDLPRPDG